MYHSLRARHHRPVIAALQKTSRRIPDAQLRGRLLDLCAKVGRSGTPGALLLRAPGRAETLSCRVFRCRTARSPRRLRSSLFVACSPDRLLAWGG